jgi:hypothetical protein
MVQHGIIPICIRSCDTRSAAKLAILLSAAGGRAAYFHKRLCASWGRFTQASFIFLLGYNLLSSFKGGKTIVISVNVD